MDQLSPERKDEGTRASSSSSSPSREADDGKELPNKQQREDDDEGTRQPYKCTFCRRGFPTAQALGGHMNVHRRHRGRPAAAAVSSTVAAATGTGSSASVYENQPCSTMTPPTVLAFSQQATHPAARAASLHAGGQRKPHELPLFGRGDCAAAGRGSDSGTAAGDAAREDRYLAKDGDGGEELDLELRLGGSPGS